MKSQSENIYIPGMSDKIRVQRQEIPPSRKKKKKRVA